MPEPSDYSAEIQSILAELGLEPVVIGALAALRYRRVPRVTTDVDFLVRRFGELPERMRSLGYDVSLVADDDGEPYVAFIRGHGRRIDVLLAETDYQREALARAIDGYLSPEDVVLHKLIAWRERDRDDIAEILASGIALDRNYVARWAIEWQVLDRWSGATGASG